MRNDRQRFQRRRKARSRKAKPARRGRRRSDLAELLLVHIQGNAAVANPVRVAAFETGAVVSEQQGAGIEQSVAGVRTIGKGSLDNGRDAEPVMPLLEVPIGWPSAADDLVQAPAVSSRQRSLEPRFVGRHGRTSATGSDLALHGSKIAIFPKRRNARGVRVPPQQGRPHQRVGCIRRNPSCSTTYRLAFATSRRPRRFTTRRSSHWESPASAPTRVRSATAKRRAASGAVA